MELPMTDIYLAKSAKDKVPEVEREMTQEDLDYYDRVGWDKYRDDDLKSRPLPELGPSSCWLGSGAPVVELKGRKYRVEFVDNYDEPWEAKGKCLILTETEDPVNVTPCFRRSYYRFFGQPRWVQGEHFPADLRGEPCCHFLTVENGWGDSGNYNILLGFDEQGVPNVAYFEASCC